MNDKKTLNFKNIGSRIRAERESLNLSRERLAEIVELSSFYIGQIERGDRRMSLETLSKISNSLHVSVDYLLYGSNTYDYDKKTNELEYQFSILESDDKNYNLELNSDLKELFDLLSRCSSKELSLIKDIIKLLIPHIRN
ncbi:helix-turn-helix transcriptional regulator [Schnuerera sp. xch1]|uniref:helix-turn-helix domain-containing protein n=1 Tax=Schnuerera sp. xch1 TaxID=2874283 RepID=UPI001CBC8F9C|nr:helix-turn-helix transcriptional regulator [Schnuerera sp. xch1]MBZ2175438.1 helix-turn-helix transcriptional regulator [Schnuerera sp. xch1]